MNKQERNTVKTIIQRGFSLGLCGVIAACSSMPDLRQSVPAKTTQLSAKERFIQAVEKQDCVISVENIGDVLVAASISADDMRRIVPELEAAGEAEVANNGVIRILSEGCI
jgi:hypothetical protein